MNGEEIESIKDNLNICLTNNTIMVKHRLEHLLQAIPQEIWTKYKSSSNSDGQPVAKLMLTWAVSITIVASSSLNSAISIDLPS